MTAVRKVPPSLFFQIDQIYIQKRKIINIGLIYLSYIKKCMQEAELFKKYTISSLLDKLDVIECYEHPNKILKFGEITEKQKDLYKLMGINLPT